MRDSFKIAVFSFSVISIIVIFVIGMIHPIGINELTKPSIVPTKLPIDTIVNHLVFDVKGKCYFVSPYVTHGESVILIPVEDCNK